MNCRDFNLLMDSDGAENLTGAQRRAVDAHLEGCESCREEWASWREVASLSVPATPPELGARILGLLPARASQPEGRRRPFVIAGLLFAGAAFAGFVALKLNAPEPESAAIVAPTTDSPELANPETPVVEESQSGAAAPVTDDDVTDPQPAVADSASVPGLDPRSVVVLFKANRPISAEALSEFQKCHDAIVSQLQAVVELNVIAGSGVSPYDNSGLSELDVARALGAGKLVSVVVSGSTCLALIQDAQSGLHVSNRIWSGDPPADGWSAFAATVAVIVRDASLDHPASVVAEVRAQLFNSALPDLTRLAALRRLSGNSAQPTPAALESDVIAAVAQIGMSSPDAFARAAAWGYLRDVDDPYLIQPLLYSVANDPDESARMAAARTLTRFIDEPGVREALLRAAETDPFPDSSDDCCFWTFAQAAERIAVPTEDLADWARGKLLDENLPPGARLLPISPFDTVRFNSVDARWLGLRELGDDAPATVFAIGSSATNPKLRSLAWEVLGNYGPDPAFAPTLLEDLKNHADEDVRASAAMALCWHVALPEVRAALEQARDDPAALDDPSALEVSAAANLALFVAQNPDDAMLTRSPTIPCAPTPQ